MSNRNSRKTISEKIISAAERKGKFNSGIARQYFSRSNSDMKTIMTVASQLTAAGTLERVSRGVYELV